MPLQHMGGLQLGRWPSHHQGLFILGSRPEWRKLHSACLVTPFRQHQTWTCRTVLQVVSLHSGRVQVRRGPIVLAAVRRTQAAHSGSRCHTCLPAASHPHRRQTVHPTTPGLPSRRRSPPPPRCRGHTGAHGNGEAEVCSRTLELASTRRPDSKGRTAAHTLDKGA